MFLDFNFFLHLAGDYSPESLLEMIALHLEATFANENIWKEFALCFLKLSRYEEDQLSVCLYGNGSERNQYFSLCYNRPPSILTDGKAGISWQFRCKWWLSRHFSNKVLTSDMATGKLCKTLFLWFSLVGVLDLYWILKNVNSFNR